MKTVEDLTDEPEAHTWETAAGLDGGTLFIGHLDQAIDVDLPPHGFRRDPEWLYGAGIGTSRAPLVMLEYACRSLRSIRKLRRIPMGLLLYTDEGFDAKSSAKFIHAAASRAKRVLVLRPAALGGGLITNRRGARKFTLSIQGNPLRPGQVSKTLPVIRWAWDRLEKIATLGSMKERLSVAALDFKTERHAMMVPHHVQVTLLMNYFDAASATQAEVRMREILGKKGPKWKLMMVSDRPPMKERAGTQRLSRALEAVAREWEIPLRRESSTWPSVAGLVGSKTACVCGIGPVCRDWGTPTEAVQRISLVQRTLLVAEYLVSQLPSSK